MKRATALRRELAADMRIPYRAHVSPHIVRTQAGHYVQVLQLGGASFESVDDETWNNWHERLNVLWRSIASPNVALWVHVIRQRYQPASPTVRGQGFGEVLAAKYHARLAGERLMLNELYLSVVFRPVAGAAPSLMSRLAARHLPSGYASELADALDASEKLAQTLASALARYDPIRLEVYERSGRWYSQVLEFLGTLLNAESQPFPLPRSPLNEALATTRVIFGSETIEYRLPTRTRFGAFLAIKEYATPTVAGMFDRMLSAPFEFVLTQSFSFLSKATAQGLLQRQHNQMANAGDFAISQAEALKDALDSVASNEFVCGEHHFTLQVLSSLSGRGAKDGSEAALKVLNDSVAEARAMLVDTGLIIAREDLALEAAYWAQLPGNFAMRPRKAVISSRNFCAKSAFHNYPAGRATGNHWGDALALLITSARSPYYFSLHASDPNDPDGGSRKDTGHTFICGQTGSGKSVFIGFMLTMLHRQGATQFVCDKDRGLEILVRSLNGQYLPLRNGQPTGFNPLQLPSTPVHIEFLKAWLRSLVRGSVPLSVREENDLDQALMGTLSLDRTARRLSRLIEFTDATRSEGIYARLARWCEVTEGPYAWAFDNPADSFVAQLSETRLFGVDVTEFLDNSVIRSPITLYLFHAIRSLLDGRRFVCWMDEFWRLLSDPAFASFAKDGPKTWRKLNGVMATATQSASDVLESDISRTIIEQTPTKIFFPNPEGNEREYVEGLGLSEREFRLIKEQLEPGSRMFLVKQGHASVVCQLDLAGFNAELKVISGRASSVEELYRIMTQVGEDPRAWLPLFQGHA